jgi:hypothetical protein
MTLRDPDDYMPATVERFRGYNHPKARVYVEYYEENGHFPPGIWEDVQLLDMKFGMQIAMGLPPEDIEED